MALKILLNGSRGRMGAAVAAALAPLKGKVVLHIENASQTVPAQITSLEAIIARKPSKS